MNAEADTAAEALSYIAADNCPFVGIAVFDNFEGRAVSVVELRALTERAAMQARELCRDASEDRRGRF